MKYALTAAMAGRVDRVTIEEMGLPSMVLMERAALCVAEKTAELAALLQRPAKIVAVCGCGNNGADGVAAARILTWQGLPTELLIVGNPDHATKEFAEQKAIAERSGVKEISLSEVESYDLIIDAVFGIGLNRPVEGEPAKLFERINAGKHAVIAVDIPSGVDATTGQLLGTALHADVTVTFGFHKQGMLLYPGRSYAGEVTVADIGFYPEAIRELNPAMYFTTADVGRLPKRLPEANKGTYGRVLVIAGSRDMSGAAYLSGGAAYRSGCGLVEIFTHDRNADVIRKLLPEAIVTGYTEENAISLLRERLPKAGVIILGPGLSRRDPAGDLVKTVFAEAEAPLIVDADALNIIAEWENFSYKGELILTPHIGEMERLSGLSKAEIVGDSVGTAKAYAKKTGAILVMKNAATVVAEPKDRCRTYVNTSGTPALAKGGSGDVLTGIIAGMLCLKLEPFSAAAMGVYLHGLCGERAESRRGAHGVLASDLLAEIGELMAGR